MSECESSITVIASNWYGRCFEKEIEFEKYIEVQYQESVVRRGHDKPQPSFFGGLTPPVVSNKEEWITNTSRYYSREIYPYYAYFERVKYLSTMLYVAIRDDCRTVTLSAKDLWILETDVSKWDD